ncbi:transposase [Escherichia coli]|nr:transposase [Escherichia coli]
MAAIKSLEYGRTIKDICRGAGLSEATYYNCKSRYGGMESSDIKKSRILRMSNRLI